MTLPETSSRPIESPPAITHEPINEDDRQRRRDQLSGSRRPFPWLMAGGASVFIGLMVTAGVTAGAIFAVPVTLVALLVLGFVVVNHKVAEDDTGPHAGNRRASRFADYEARGPHFVLDEETALGDSPELSAEEQQSHADMNRSSGRR